MPRYIPPGSTVDVTTKTVDDRYLLRPSQQLNDIIDGILGRALSKYPVQLHGHIVMSNHVEMLLTPPNARVLAAFMNHVNSNLAREAGRIHNWRSRLFARRYRSIVVLDDDAAIGRLRYIMSHGAKEGLVWDPEHWPGSNSLRALVHGEKITGTWYDRTAYCRAKAQGKNVRLQDFATTYEVPLSPLPCWRHLSDEEHRERCRQLLDDIRDELRQWFKTEGVVPLGPRAVRRQDPLGKPRAPKRTPAPVCLASSRRVRRQFKRELREFLSAYTHASERLRDGDRDVTFPAYSFPPPLAFVMPDTQARLGP